MNKIARQIACLLVLAACMNANAGIFDEDARKEVADVKKQIEQQNTDNDARFTKVDEAIKNIGIIQLLNQIEVLNGEIAKLRGQLEVLTNQNEQLQKRQKDFYLDLDTRIHKLETDLAASVNTAPTLVPGPVVPIVPASDSAPGPAAASVTVRPAGVISARDKDAETNSYDVGANHFKKMDFLAAIGAFQNFQKDFPGSALMPNAQYWIGIAHFQLKEYAEARKIQDALIKKYPDSAKVPDAILAVASIYFETGDNGSARNALEDIIAKYPTSDAAVKARTRLTAKK